MEPVSRSELLNELDQLGYSLFRAQKVDPVQTLAKLVQTDDIRLLEGFPIVLATSLLQGLLSVENIAAVETGVKGAGLRKPKAIPGLKRLFEKPAVFWEKNSTEKEEFVTKKKKP